MSSTPNNPPSFRDNYNTFHSQYASTFNSFDNADGFGVTKDPFDFALSSFYSEANNSIMESKQILTRIFNNYGNIPGYLENSTLTGTDNPALQLQLNKLRSANVDSLFGTQFNSQTANSIINEITGFDALGSLRELQDKLFESDMKGAREDYDTTIASYNRYDEQIRRQNQWEQALNITGINTREILEPVNQAEYYVRPGIFPAIKLLNEAQSEINIDIYQFQNTTIRHFLLNKINLAYTDPNRNNNPLKINIRLAAPFEDAVNNTSYAILGPNIMLYNSLLMMSGRMGNDSALRDRVEINFSWAGRRSHPKLTLTDKMVSIGSMNFTDPLGKDITQGGSNLEITKLFNLGEKRNYKEFDTWLENNPKASTSDFLSYIGSQGVDDANSRIYYLARKIMLTHQSKLEDDKYKRMPTSTGSYLVAGPQETYQHLRDTLALANDKSNRGIVRFEAVLNQQFLLQFPHTSLTESNSNVFINKQKLGEMGTEIFHEYSDRSEYNTERDRHIKYMDAKASIYRDTIQRPLFELLSSGKNGAIIYVDPHNFREQIINPFYEEMGKAGLFNYTNKEGVYTQGEYSDLGDLVSKLGIGGIETVLNNRYSSDIATPYIQLGKALAYGNIRLASFPRVHVKSYGLFSRATDEMYASSTANSSNYGVNSLGMEEELINQLGWNRQQVKEMEEKYVNSELGNLLTHTNIQSKYNKQDNEYNTETDELLNQERIGFRNLVNKVGYTDINYIKRGHYSIYNYNIDKNQLEQLYSRLYNISLKTGFDPKTKIGGAFQVDKNYDSFHNLSHITVTIGDGYDRRSIRSYRFTSLKDALSTNQSPNSYFLAIDQGRVIDRMAVVNTMDRTLKYKLGVDIDLVLASGENKTLNPIDTVTSLISTLSANYYSSRYLTTPFERYKEQYFSDAFNREGNRDVRLMSGTMNYLAQVLNTSSSTFSSLISEQMSSPDANFALNLFYRLGGQYSNITGTSPSGEIPANYYPNQIKNMVTMAVGGRYSPQFLGLEAGQYITNSLDRVRELAGIGEDTSTIGAFTYRSQGNEYRIMNKTHFAEELSALVSNIAFSGVPRNEPNYNPRLELTNNLTRINNLIHSAIHSDYSSRTTAYHDVLFDFIKAQGYSESNDIRAMVDTNTRVFENFLPFTNYKVLSGPQGRARLPVFGLGRGKEAVAEKMKDIANRQAPGGIIDIMPYAIMGHRYQFDPTSYLGQGDTSFSMRIAEGGRGGANTSIDNQFSKFAGGVSFSFEGNVAEVFDLEMLNKELGIGNVIDERDTIEGGRKWMEFDFGKYLQVPQRLKNAIGMRPTLILSHSVQGILDSLQKGETPSISLNQYLEDSRNSFYQSFQDEQLARSRFNEDFLDMAFIFGGRARSFLGENQYATVNAIYSQVSKDKDNLDLVDPSLDSFVTDTILRAHLVTQEIYGANKGVLGGRLATESGGGLNAVLVGLNGGFSDYGYLSPYNRPRSGWLDQATKSVKASMLISDQGIDLQENKIINDLIRAGDNEHRGFTFLKNILVDDGDYVTYDASFDKYVLKSGDGVTKQVLSTRKEVEIIQGAMNKAGYNPSFGYISGTTSAGTTAGEAGLEQYLGVRLLPGNDATNEILVQLNVLRTLIADTRRIDSLGGGLLKSPNQVLSKEVWSNIITQLESGYRGDFTAYDESALEGIDIAPGVKASQISAFFSMNNLKSYSYQHGANLLSHSMPNLPDQSLFIGRLNSFAPAYSNTGLKNGRLKIQTALYMLGADINLLGINENTIYENALAGSLGDPLKQVATILQATKGSEAFRKFNDTISSGLLSGSQPRGLKSDLYNYLQNFSNNGFFSINNMLGDLTNVANQSMERGYLAVDDYSGRRMYSYLAGGLDIALQMLQDNKRSIRFDIAPLLKAANIGGQNAKAAMTSAMRALGTIVGFDKSVIETAANKILMGTHSQQGYAVDDGAVNTVDYLMNEVQTIQLFMDYSGSQSKPPVSSKGKSQYEVQHLFIPSALRETMAAFKSGTDVKTRLFGILFSPLFQTRTGDVEKALRQSSKYDDTAKTIEGMPIYSFFDRDNDGRGVQSIYSPNFSQQFYGMYQSPTASNEIYRQAYKDLQFLETAMVALTTPETGAAYWWDTEYRKGTKANIQTLSAQLSSAITQLNTIKKHNRFVTNTLATLPNINNQIDKLHKDFVKETPGSKEYIKLERRINKLYSVISKKGDLLGQRTGIDFQPYFLASNANIPSLFNNVNRFIQDVTSNYPTIYNNAIQQNKQTIHNLNSLLDTALDNPFTQGVSSIIKNISNLSNNFNHLNINSSNGGVNTTLFGFSSSALVNKFKEMRQVILDDLKKKKLQYNLHTGKVMGIADSEAAISALQSRGISTFLYEIPELEYKNGRIYVSNQKDKILGISLSPEFVKAIGAQFGSYESELSKTMVGIWSNFSEDSTIKNFFAGLNGSDANSVINEAATNGIIVSEQLGRELMAFQDTTRKSVELVYTEMTAYGQELMGNRVKVPGGTVVGSASFLVGLREAVVAPTVLTQAKQVHSQKRQEMYLQTLDYIQNSAANILGFSTLNSNSSNTLNSEVARGSVRNLLISQARVIREGISQKQLNITNLQQRSQDIRNSIADLKTNILGAGTGLTQDDKDRVTAIANEIISYKNPIVLGKGVNPSIYDEGFISDLHNVEKKSLLLELAFVATDGSLNPPNNDVINLIKQQANNRMDEAAESTFFSIENRERYLHAQSIISGLGTGENWRQSLHTTNLTVHNLNMLQSNLYGNTAINKGLSNITYRPLFGSEQVAYKITNKLDSNVPSDRVKAQSVINKAAQRSLASINRTVSGLQDTLATESRLLASSLGVMDNDGGYLQQQTEDIIHKIGLIHNDASLLSGQLNTLIDPQGVTGTNKETIHAVNDYIQALNMRLEHELVRFQSVYDTSLVQAWRSPPPGSMALNQSTFLNERINTINERFSQVIGAPFFDVERAQTLSLYNPISLMASMLGDWDGDTISNVLFRKSNLLIEAYNTTEQVKAAMQSVMNVGYGPHLSSNIVPDSQVEYVNKLINKQQAIHNDIERTNREMAQYEDKAIEWVANYTKIDKQYLQGMSPEMAFAFTEKARGLYDLGISSEAGSKLEQITSIFLENISRSSVGEVLTNLPDASFINSNTKTTMVDEIREYINLDNSELAGQLNTFLSKPIYQKDKDELVSILHRGYSSMTAFKNVAKFNKMAGGVVMSEQGFELMSKVLGNAGSKVLGKTYNTTIGLLYQTAPSMAMANAIANDPDVEQGLRAILHSSDSNLSSQQITDQINHYRQTSNNLIDHVAKLGGFIQATHQILRDSIKPSGKGANSFKEAVEQLSGEYFSEGTDEARRQAIIGELSSELQIAPLTQLDTFISKLNEVRQYASLNVDFNSDTPIFNNPNDESRDLLSELGFGSSRDEINNNIKYYQKLNKLDSGEGNSLLQLSSYKIKDDLVGLITQFSFLNHFNKDAMESSGATIAKEMWGQALAQGLDDDTLRFINRDLLGIQGTLSLSLPDALNELRTVTAGVNKNSIQSIISSYNPDTSTFTDANGIAIKREALEFARLTEQFISPDTETHLSQMDNHVLFALVNQYKNSKSVVEGFTGAKGESLSEFAEFNITRSLAYSQNDPSTGIFSPGNLLQKVEMVNYGASIGAGEQALEIVYGGLDPVSKAMTQALQTGKITDPQSLANLIPIFSETQLGQHLEMIGKQNGAQVSSVLPRVLGNYQTNLNGEFVNFTNIMTHLFSLEGGDVKNLLMSSLQSTAVNKEAATLFNIAKSGVTQSPTARSNSEVDLVFGDALTPDQKEAIVQANNRNHSQLLTPLELQTGVTNSARLFQGAANGTPHQQTAVETILANQDIALSSKAQTIGNLYESIAPLIGIVGNIIATGRLDEDSIQTGLGNVLTSIAYSASFTSGYSQNNKLGYWSGVGSGIFNRARFGVTALSLQEDVSIGEYATTVAQQVGQELTMMASAGIINKTGVVDTTFEAIDDLMGYNNPLNAKEKSLNSLIVRDTVKGGLAFSVLQLVSPLIFKDKNPETVSASIQTQSALSEHRATNVAIAEVMASHNDKLQPKMEEEQDYELEVISGDGDLVPYLKVNMIQMDKYADSMEAQSQFYLSLEQDSETALYI